MRDKKKFDAFISYNRKTDLDFSEKLQHHLQTFAKPWYKSRVTRIFRDKTNIRPSSSIGIELKDAIDNSSFFILIASPGSADSQWVNNEIKYWFENHPADRFIIILTSGSIGWDNAKRDFDWDRTDALPEGLSSRFKSEPLYIDATWYSGGVSELNVKNIDFFDLLKTVSATLQKIDKDLLADQYRKQQYRSVSIFAGLTMLVIFSLITTLVFKKLSDDNKKLAHANQQLAQIENALHSARNAEVMINKGYPHEAFELLQESFPMDMRQSDRPYVTEVEEQYYNFLQKTVADSAYYCFSSDRDGYYTSGLDLYLVTIDPMGKYFAVAMIEKDRHARSEKIVRYGFSIHSIAKKATIYQSYSLNREQKVKSFQFSTTGDHLMAVLENNQIQVINTRDLSTVNRFDFGVDIDKLVSCPDGQRALCIGAKSHFIFDIKTGKQSVTFGQHGNLSGDGGFNLTGDRYLSIPDDIDEMAVLYDADTGKIIKELPNGGSDGEKQAENEEQFNSDDVITDYFRPRAVFGPDNRLLVTLFKDLTIRVFNARDGELLGAVEQRAINFDISPDGKSLVCALTDNTALIWEIENQKPLRLLKGHTKALTKVRYNPDGRSVLTISEDQSAKLWDPENGRFIATIKNELSDASFSPDGRHIVTTSGGFRGDDNSARVWDAHTGKFEKYIAGNFHEDYISFATFSGGNKDVTYFIENWNAPDDVCTCEFENDGTVETFLEGQDANICFLEFSRDGTKLLTGHRTNYLKLWDIESGSVIFRSRLSTGAKSGRDKNSGFDCQRAIFSPDENVIATIVDGRAARILDARTGKLLQELVHDDVVNDLNFSSDGRRIVIAYQGDAAIVWDTRTGEKLKTYEKPFHSDYSGHPGITKALYSPDDSKLLLVGHYGIGLIDLSTDEEWGNSLFEMPIEHTIFSQDSNYLIISHQSVFDSEGTHVWDLKSGKFASRNAGYLQSKNGIAGKRPYLALWDEIGGSGGVARLAYVYNYITGEKIQEIYYGQMSVELSNLTISANGEHLLISEPDAVSVWKVRTGKKIFEYNVDDDVIAGAQFSPNGTNIAVAVESGKIIVLKMFASTQDLITALRP